MKLGGRTQFQISTSDVGRSISFYKLMGFKELAYSKKPFKWVALSDGNLNILLAETEFYGLCYYADDMQDKAVQIEGQGIDYVSHDLHLGETWYKIVRDPNDFLMSLVAEVPSYLDEVNKNEYEPRGKFYEIGILTGKIKESVKFWEKLGFEKSDHDNKRGVSLNDGNMGIGLYSQESNDHYFAGPALTFYDEGMQTIIQDLKEAGLDFQEEIKDDKGKITGAIALSPEGQAFFLFTG